MDKTGECVMKRTCGNCKHLGCMNAGGVDFECGVSVCKIRPFGSSSVNHNDAGCERHEFNQCLVIVKDGRYFRRWTDYLREAEFTDDIGEAAVFHEWYHMWNYIRDDYFHVTGGWKMRHVSGERHPYPFYLADKPEFLSRVDN